MSNPICPMCQGQGPAHTYTPDEEYARCKRCQMIMFRGCIGTRHGCDDGKPHELLPITIEEAIANPHPSHIQVLEHIQRRAGGKPAPTPFMAASTPPSDRNEAILSEARNWLDRNLSQLDSIYVALHMIPASTRVALMAGWQAIAAGNIASLNNKQLRAYILACDELARWRDTPSVAHSLATQMQIETFLDLANIVEAAPLPADFQRPETPAVPADHHAAFVADVQRVIQETLRQHSWPRIV